MSILVTSRLFNAVALSCLVVGCGGSSSPVSQPLGLNRMSQLQSVSPAAGGSFSASYSGKYTLRGNNKPFEYTFQGIGKGSFINKSTEAGEIFYYCGLHGCFIQSGSHATLTSRRNDANTINITFPFDKIFSCGTRVAWYVTGGTGMFAHATGSGTVTFTCHTGRTYTDTWKGTLYF